VGSNPTPSATSEQNCFNSYALQPFEGGIFGSDALTASNNAIRTANAKRVVRQRIGFAFLCVSFAIQAVAVFL
jgi:hypothetical protein